MTKENEKVEKPRDIQILDDLIEKFYSVIINEEIKDVKIGDLLKMMEVKRKLAPDGKDQKEFWKMIDNIRQESNEKPKLKRKTKRTKKTKRKITKKNK